MNSKLNADNKIKRSLPSKRIWCITFCVFSLLYLLTVQKGLSWQDSGMFQWRIINADYTGRLGLALAHPLYILIGRLFLHIPFGDILTRLNFMSGIAMAVAIANLAVLTTQLTGYWWIGLAAASMLSVTHTVWWLATITEVYSWHAALFTLELLLLTNLLRNTRWGTAVGLFFFNGLNLGIHNLALLTLPVYVVVLIILTALKRLPLWIIPVSSLVYISGASPYILLIVKYAINHDDIFGAISSALFGKYTSEVLNIKVAWPFMKANAGLVLLNFINLTLPMAVTGWLKMKKCLGIDLALSFGAITVIEFIFFVRYSVPDQFTFILPSLVMIIIAASVGISVFNERFKEWRAWLVCACILSVLAPPFLYSNAYKIVDLSGINVKRDRERPFRNEIRYWMIPWKQNERSAEYFSAAAIKQALPNGMIICDTTSYYTLLLAQKRYDSAAGIYIVSYGDIKDQSVRDSTYLRNILLQRPIYVIGTVKKKLSEEIQDNIKFKRDKDDVLYSVIW